jgi:16S rRNA (cytosine967-C5)-methyltransferase
MTGKLNPRAAALEALIEWERGRTFADEILHRVQAEARFSARDRGFFREVFYGVIRWLSEIDFLIGRLRDGPIDDHTRAVLRLGVYQLWHMRVPPHAVVNESVSLAGRARGLVNAILRRALREENALRQALAAAPEAVRWSHPEFLIERWNAAFGSENAAALCEWNNLPAPVFVRVNGLRASVDELLAGNRGAERTRAHPRALKVDQLPPHWIDEGLCYVQDPSTLQACDLLAPRPGEMVLDLCAAPGGKTSYLAELMENRGRIVACDLWESRLERLRENMHRLGVRNVQPLQHDGMIAGGELPPGSFDRVLVDAPCSNTGVIRRRVDVRWRLTDEDFVRMPAQQLALLRRAVALLKPGGTLVYSSCSLEREENEEVVERLVEEVGGMRVVEMKRTLPFVDDVDGAFAAKLVRG